MDTVRDDVKEEDCITITTIHSAKGREWKAVFVIDAFEEVDFDGTPILDMEELRCWYVALTRAKERLYISVPQYTNGIFRELTSFIDERNFL